MDSSQQTIQTQQSAQQTPTPQILIGQQVSPIVTAMEVSQTDHNSGNDSSVNSGVSVSMSGTIISSNASQTQTSSTSTPNLCVTSSSMPSVVVSTGMPTQVSIPTPSTQSQQLIVSSSQPQLVPTSQSAQMNANNALMAQSLGATITSVANHAVQMAAQQSSQPNPMQPLIQTSVQPTGSNQMNTQMSVAMSSLPQVQVIQQPTGYQFQQVYPQQMILPANLTIQNMPFGALNQGNQGLSLQIPFTGTGGVTTATMPITSIAAKPPIMSKGMSISHLNQQHMISQLRPNMGSPGTQFLKQVLPAQQFIQPHSTANQIVISQLLPHQNQHQIQQSILPSNHNKALLEAPKGKPFGTGSVRSAFGNKMLSHSGAIQPKSPILPATSISSSLIANSQFKSPFPTNQNTTQLIQSPSNLINQQIFQTLPPGLTWATSPQSTHLVAPNGSPIFIRGPTQGGEHMFISTSNMATPQIQSMSMATPINVQNSATMQVNSTPTHSTHMTTTSLQPISTVSNMTVTTAPVNTSQHQVIAPAPIASVNKPRTVRQASSVATQTATPAQKPDTPSVNKPIAIAPAIKPKSSPQPIIQNTKPVNKETNSPAVRSTSVGTTQTSVQSTPPTNKNDVINQIVKKSVATETVPSSGKPKSQVSSSRMNEQNKELSSKSHSISTNTNSDTTTQVSQQKVNSNTDLKIATKRAPVEKKDASTEQELDMNSNSFAQNNYKSVQNPMQTTSNSLNNTSLVNGTQIPVLSDLNRQDISKQPQKAIVKPQILTHVIDGYIIQESPNPFPVNGLTYSDPKTINDEKNNTIVIPIESIKSKNKNENTNASSSRNRSTSGQLCLNCGAKRKANSKNNRTLKKFCSISCSDKFNSHNNEKTSPPIPRIAINAVTAQVVNNDVQKRNDLNVELSSNDTEKQTIDDRRKLKSLKRSHENTNDFNSTKNGDINGTIDRNLRKSTASVEIINETVVQSVNAVPPTQMSSAANDEPIPSAIAGLYIPPGGRNPLQWSVNDVFEFVRNLQGCEDYADEFRGQEIDGQALMLIKEDHLMNTMNMKLGPALKICSKIKSLREDV